MLIFSLMKAFPKRRGSQSVDPDFRRAVFSKNLCLGHSMICYDSCWAHVLFEVFSRVHGRSQVLLEPFSFVSIEPVMPTNPSPTDSLSGRIINGSRPLTHNTASLPLGLCRTSERGTGWINGKLWDDVFKFCSF